MWWPRPRWKSDLFTHFILLLFVIIVSTINSVMADEEQHCGGSNMSALVWTTVFCTMLLILLVIAIYFVYCKRREQSWSSLWRKNNTDKNLVLQTLPPSKCSGTDNPAFITDSNIGDHVKGTAITKVMRLPTSTINDGSLGIELSTKEESNRRIYLYKHNDGSKDRLVALRLVFDKEQQKPQQQSYSLASDLNLALVELSRKYGLHVELETEGEDNVNVTSVAMSKHNNGNMTKSVKSNILSTVCGKAQRLWHQRPFFKHDENCGRAITDKETNDDVKNDSAAVIIAANKGVISLDQKTLSSCSVTTIDETSTVAKDTSRHYGGSLRYRTLEYGASPADMMAQSSSDSNVQSCTVNVSEVLVEPVATSMINKNVAVTVEASGMIDAQINQIKPKSDESKNSSTNPPPPPPRKYNMAVISPSSAAAVVNTSRVTSPPPTIPSSTTNTCASSITNTTADDIIVTAVIPSQTVLDNTPLPVANLTADKDLRPLHQTGNEIGVDDDYYWCTTTAMAIPPMSTFGKQSSVSAADRTSEKSVSDADTIVVIDTIVNSAIDVQEDGGNNNLVDGNRDVMAAAGGTTSIEDASLPPFLSDEEDDDMDRSDFAAKKTTKFECSTVTTADINGVCNGNISNGTNNHDRRDNCDMSAVTKAESRFNDAQIEVQIPESKSTTRLPTLRLSLSSPPMTSTSATSCSSSLSSSASSASSTSSSMSSSSSSPINNGSNINSPIVSKIPVRRQSSGSNGGGTIFSTPIITNGTTKKAIPLPLSRSGSRLAMWSSAN